MAAFSIRLQLAMKIICRFLVNEHDDLYFLWHNFVELIILFMLKKLKEICWTRLKDIAESVKKIAS